MSSELLRSRNKPFLAFIFYCQLIQERKQPSKEAKAKVTEFREPPWATSMAAFGILPTSTNQESQRRQNWWHVLYPPALASTFLLYSLTSPYQSKQEQTGPWTVH
jgi:hypothetical protein